MSSKISSCFGSFFLLIVALVLIRFTLPSLWKVIAGIFTGTLYFGLFLFLSFLIALGYFTYRNLKKNKVKAEQQKFAPVTRADTLYRSVVQRLQQDMVLNQVSAEEYLQSEILIGESLQELKKDLNRLKDFASAKNEKQTVQQIREYQRQLQESSDATVKEVVRENIRMLDEKRQRIHAVKEEIRQKEGSIDLISNHLEDIEEDIKFGRTVYRLFPAEIYRRFGLNPPPEQERLPPFAEKSSDA